MKNITSDFHAMVDKYSSTVGSRPAEMMHEDFASGEAVIAFENLIQGLRQSGVEIPADDRAVLKEIASALACLDYEAGKGHYW